jgi:hypothetical protein
VLAAPGAGSKPCETTTWQPNDLVLWGFGGAVSAEPMKRACNQLFDIFMFIYQLPLLIYKMVFQIFYKMDVPDPGI